MRQWLYEALGICNTPFTSEAFNSDPEVCTSGEVHKILVSTGVVFSF